MSARGIRNNNPGNIRPGQGFKGEVGDDGEGYARFDTIENGIRAIAVDLLTKMSNAIDTVREIVTKYAPPTENDTAAYIKSVCAATGFKEDEILNLNHIEQLRKVVRAIIVHENGRCPYSDAVIEVACMRALRDKGYA